MQGPAIEALAQFHVGLLGRDQCTLGGHGDVARDLVIHGFDAREECFGEVQSR